MYVCVFYSFDIDSLFFVVSIFVFHNRPLRYKTKLNFYDNVLLILIYVQLLGHANNLSFHTTFLY